MSYEPTNWQTGDVVTSQKLNKLEQGVADAGGGGGGNLVLHISYDEATTTFTANYTAGEIKSALESGRDLAAPYQSDDGTGVLYGIVYASNTSDLSFYYDIGESKYVLNVPDYITEFGISLILTAATEDDYPSYTSG